MRVFATTEPSTVSRNSAPGGAATDTVSPAIFGFAASSTVCARSYALLSAGLGFGGNGSRNTLRSISVPSTNLPAPTWHSPRRLSTIAEWCNFSERSSLGIASSHLPACASLSPSTARVRAAAISVAESSSALATPKRLSCSTPVPSAAMVARVHEECCRRDVIAILSQPNFPVCTLATKWGNVPDTNRGPSYLETPTAYQPGRLSRCRGARRTSAQRQDQAHDFNSSPQSGRQRA